ncbi:MAG: cardiolipin synthase, partial [Terrimicrobiaceae bacterium]|nr:cardiolipin synthase [Terrimicrobiaceae bacterium]
ALLFLPAIAIPCYWIFGESRFSGYVLAGEGREPALDEAARKIIRAAMAFADPLSPKYADAERIALNLTHIGAIGGNRVHLLVDGAAAFEAMFQALETATRWAVVQFYIIHDDGLGRRLKEALLAAAERGVKCRVLYDAVGSKGLGSSWTAPLSAAGVDVRAFVTNRQHGRRFQVNFRNHRKLVVVDGRIGFVGGLNAGDEYLGLGPLGAWRDTHLRVEGPAAAMMVPFLEDWFYAAREIPNLEAEPERRGSRRVLPFASGPAQTWHTAPAIYLEILHDVRERLWIASPYFVPDPPTRAALAAAALRGVDVRILLPGVPDHLLPWLSSFTYYPQMREAGVQIWRHSPGFMHQKVLLADSDLAIVGSVNLDYRSFLINFESAVLVEDRGFASEVEAMLLRDFAQSTKEDLSFFDRAPFLFRLKCRLASPLSP